MKPTIRTVCVILGACLLVTAFAGLGIWQWNIHASQKQTQSYVDTLLTLIPAPEGAVPEQRRENTMPVLAVDGVDFAGILEMPRYGSALPVGDAWGNSHKYPCRFTGSIYDGTLQIGATSQAGQYDFYREISVGDTVCFTDMEGNRFTYGVTDIRYESHADQAAFGKKDAGLILFIKNVYALEYIVIFCNAAS